MKSKPVTSLELYPDIEINHDDGSLTVLIKHDYYSTENDHGRELLSSVLNAILDDTDHYVRIILIDSAVRILSDYPDISCKLKSFYDNGSCVSVCKESLDFYYVDCSDMEFLDILSASSIFAELTCGDIRYIVLD